MIYCIKKPAIKYRIWNGGFSPKQQICISSLPWVEAEQNLYYDKSTEYDKPRNFSTFHWFMNTLTLKARTPLWHLVLCNLFSHPSNMVTNDEISIRAAFWNYPLGRNWQESIWWIFLGSICVVGTLYIPGQKFLGRVFWGRKNQ